MSRFAPTPEQQEALDAFATGDTVVIEAGAGSGKTATLELVSEEAQAAGKRVLYIAYNKAIADEASTRFPRNTTCSTAHALAFRAGGKYWAHRLRTPRQNAKQIAEILGITAPESLGSDTPTLTPQQLARLAIRTVEKFCGTADAKIGPQHVVDAPAFDTDGKRAALAKVIVPLAEIAWADLALKDGKLRYQHDYYLKRWQLSGPRLEYDLILLDECQDADPVVAAVFKAQAVATYREDGTVASTAKQLGLVGDQQQAIYAWRGAGDIMGDFPGSRRVKLTKSFRFGPAVAAEANRWLELLDAGLRMVGHDPIASTLGPVADPDAIICRTNAGAVSAVLDAHAEGKRVAMVGGGRETKSLAEAAQELQRRGYTNHPELQMFVSWTQVVEYVEAGEYGSEDLKAAVSLIKKYTAQTVIDAIARLVDEADADVVVTTAHKAKGREWDAVRVGDDFQEPKGDELDRGEAMLAYVTVTRAKKHLDRGSLSWIDSFGAAPFQPAPAPVAIPAPAPAPAVEITPSAVEEAAAAVDAARDPLARAVALLSLVEARAAAGEVRGPAERAADVRAIVAAYAATDDAFPIAAAAMAHAI